VTDVGGQADLSTKPKRADQSLGELFGQMTRELGELFRKEVELARVETRDEIRRTGAALGAMGGAAVGALLFLSMASVAAALGLAEVINRALAFAIVAAVWAVIAAVLFVIGRNRLAQVRPLPETTETLKEDMQWAKTLKS
jgi:hypothetical protein